ncbi:LacI family transcriptional regulator [Acidobacteria bacterium AH-259-G07]|nr:LacI family transcriptional regulator [Acidobacteria bacterium AH-259-G07]
MVKKKRKSRRKVTLQDIAQRVQVSISSVSRVVSNYPGVHPELRLRIERAMRELDYRPISSRRTFQKPGNYIIYFLLTNRDLDIPVHSRILQAIEKETTAEGDLLLFRSFRYNPGSPPEDLNIFQSIELTQLGNRALPAGGVILTGLTYPNLLDALGSLEIPYVLLGNNYAGSDELTSDAVIFDGHQGACDATRYLIDLGHTNILFVGDPNIGWFSSLYQGYVEALNEAGLKPFAQTKTLSDSFYSNGYFSVEMAFEQLREITAIFAGCDEIAMGAWKALNDRNLSVPQDVSLVGFDDEEYAAFTVPPLSTVRIDVEAIGRELVRQLYRKLEDPSLKLPLMNLSTTLIKRGTCRPLAVLSESV